MIEVLEGGIQTTVQDFPGRQGLLDQGICPAGPFDSVAFRLANLLVGNDPGAAALEITAGGFRARFDRDTVFAVCGADMQPTLDGAPIDRWRSYAARTGQTLALGKVEGPGFRAYLAVAGGVDVPEYLGSRSTYVPGAIGGFEGRALKKGDRLPIGEPARTTGVPDRRVKPELVPEYVSDWELEAVPGPQAAPDYFTWDDYDHFFSHHWKLDRNSNRMGYRLEPHQWQWARKSGGVAGGHPSNILDNGYAVGAVNITGDQPIILCVDGPTLGGFICAAGVAYGAMWKLGQMVPGRDRIRFKEQTIEDAAELARRTEGLIAEASLEGVAP
ncbi:MAG TPA: 5-oxoprolinase/urea amidolyase family protein [Thermomicrobiales bacterium]|nr:5-oxoprolinase/urea amidolyase family protein [Thermomicrobiales bacterium]